MSEERHFFIPGDPMGKERPYFAQGHVFTRSKTKAYEQAVQFFYLAQCHYPPFPKDVPLCISIKAVFEPPKSTGKKRLRDMLLDMIRPTKRPDWDNIGKITCDSLNKIAYHDDSQITTAHVFKRYGKDAGVEVWISKEDV